MFNSSRSFLVPEVTTIRNLQNTKLNLNKNYFSFLPMNSINLFPVEEKQTLRAEKLKFSFSFSGYGSYMTISDKDKELTIYLDDKSVKDQIIFNINNLSSEYSRDKTFLITIFKSIHDKL